MPEDIAQILNRVSRNEPGGAATLMEILYDNLHSLAARYLGRENKGHTLSATDLVNEAYLKLLHHTQVDWKGRTHFFAVGAQAMRRILVDHARTKHRQKRGGKARKVEFRDDLVATDDKPELTLAIDQAITKLAALEPDHARIVELRFFGGLKAEEIALRLGVSARTVERHWKAIRAWLRRELAGNPSD
jgi:RNA polymerase sigma-70 factor (ECF subfamily)